MGAGGLASLVFGRVYDRTGIGLLVPLTAIGVLFAPLSFLGGPGPALGGGFIWGAALGVHESVMAAAGAGAGARGPGPSPRPPGRARPSPGRARLSPRRRVSRAPSGVAPARVEAAEARDLDALAALELAGDDAVRAEQPLHRALRVGFLEPRPLGERVDQLGLVHRLSRQAATV